MKTFFRLLPFFLLPALLPAQADKGATPLSSPQGTFTGVTRAVVVGISDYQHPAIPDLQYAHRDAEAFAAWLQSPAGGSLDANHLVLLTNEQATLGQFAKALDELIDECKPGDEAIIYFSGHGDVEGKIMSQPGYLLLWDAPARVYLSGGACALNGLEGVVQTLSLHNKVRVLVIADACHAGLLAGSRVGGTAITGANLARQYANEIKILSCQPNEFSLEGKQWGGGRGVFSYHLTEGLYGLADLNRDRIVTLHEIGRYLEDHVTSEVAPQGQIPLVQGDRAATVAEVSPDVLEQLIQYKRGELPVFLPMEQKNIDAYVLETVTPPVQALYAAFTEAVRTRRFFGPEGTSADACFRQLMDSPETASLRGLLKRNYAAALQDEAQQSVNALLSMDIQVVQRSVIEKARQYRSAPSCLARAAELLGPGHYMYNTLKARELLFEGLAIYLDSYMSDDLAGSRKALEKYRLSLQYQPESPLAYYYLSLCYSLKIKEPDSAWVYAREAMRLNETWTLPYAHLAYHFARYHQRFEDAEVMLQEAAKRDPDDAVVWNSKGALFYYQDKYTEAINAYRHVLRLDSTNALAWTNIGVALVETLQYGEAEIALQTAIRLNPGQFSSRYVLGSMLTRSGRFKEAEAAFLQAVQINPNHIPTRDSLAAGYLRQGRRAEAETQFLEIVRINPLHHPSWYALACLYSADGKRMRALECLQQALAAGITEVEALLSDPNLENLRLDPEFKLLLQKYFPAQEKK